MDRGGSFFVPKHELVHTREDMPVFVGNHKNGSIMEFSEHWHRSVEVTYNWLGEIEFYINGEYQKLHEEELIVINSGQIHRIVPLVCESAAPKAVRATTVLLPYEFFKNAYPALDATYFVLRDIKERDELIETVKALGAIFGSDIQGYDYMRVQALAWQMMYFLCTFFAEKRSEYVSWQEEKNLGNIYQILTWLRENYYMQLTEQQIAAHFHFSREHFSRLIKRYTGVNFKTYLTKLRLAAAYKKLMTTEDSVLQIALDCGFGDSRAFIRAFTAVYMQTPGEYRKAERERLHKKSQN